MANTVINTPELLNLDSTTGATVLAKGTVNERPETPTFSLDYLVVAGGGGGIYSTSPGGAAGGLRTSYGSTSGGGEGAESSLNVISGASFTVTVGNGGPKINASNASNPSRGGNSVFGTITSLGGGIGVSGNDSDGILWTNGGSGAGGRYGGLSGGQGTAGQGFAGGSINGAPDYKAGGSGGAGGVGLDATGSAYSGGSGAGGPGLAVNILNATNAATASVGQVSGSDVYYAGGGGGGSDSYRSRPAGAGGIGGGGAGGYYSNGTSATANTGGGGGGGANRPNTMEGGDGGSGVIILRYPNSVSATVNGATQASGSPFTEGNDKITVLTSGTGTITFTDSTPTNPDEYPINGTLRFNTETNKTEYFDGTGWYEIVDEYASGFIGPGTNYFDTKLYTGNGATQSIGGYINGSGSFNGSSRITLPSGSPFNTSNTVKSISVWIKPSTLTSRVFPYGASDSSNSQSYFQVGWFNDLSFIRINVTQGSSSVYSRYEATITPTTNWVHLLVQLTSTGKEIYVNGVELSGTYSNSGGGSNTDWIGDVPSIDNHTIGISRLNTPSYSDGDIDQVRIYSTALSSSDVTALYNETAATATTAAYPSGQTAIATYTMDTSANGLLNTQDLSTVDYPSGTGCIALYEMNGNSNDTSGTYNGTPTNITYQGGAFDQAAVFNGSNSYIALGANTPLNNFNGEQTISAWIYPTTAIQQSIIGYRDDSTLKWNYFRMNSNRTLSFLLRDSSSISSATTVGLINLNAWNHVCVTIDSSNINFYINGGTAEAFSNSVGSFTSSEPTDIGRRGSYSDQYFNGSIDQVRIFNTALTQSQVTTLARGIATSYSGIATNVNFNGHLDFQPDLVWIKNRDATQSNRLYDSVRGANLQISSNQTAVEGNSGGLTSFDSNGFSLNSWASVNTNNNDYVSWNWKAGGTAVTNNDGTIASQVSANQDAGFSIVKYIGNGLSSEQTVGHGLDYPPELVIIKDLDNVRDWYVYTDIIDGSMDVLYLNKADAKVNSSRTSPTSNVYKIAGNTTLNKSNQNFISYCFHSVSGYSSIGTYSGTSSSGNAITGLGFQPNWLMVKRTDVSGGSWLIVDNRRVENNGNLSELFANTTTAETGTGYDIDFTSDGFTLNTTTSNANASGTNNYIYMAIA